MKHLFVSYEIAKQLKEKEFNEHCLAGFLIGDDGQFCIYGLETNHEDLLVNESDWLNCPLYQQVIDWLREKYHFYLKINVNENDESTQKHYFFTISDLEWGADKEIRFLKKGNKEITYNKALTKGIEKALKLI